MDLMFFCLVVVIGLMIFKVSVISYKKNVDVSFFFKIVVYYIYSINSLIGKFGINDVNIVGIFLV